MKKTLIALAAAATVSLGANGVASAASTATSAASLDITVKTGVSTQEVGYYHNRFYGNYGYHYQYCKHLYYKGWVLDSRRAQIEYLRHCRYKYNY
ncbi:MAG TPA: hypothetical protein VM325_12015 [Alphaproteobacteria bacterium]|nr:hypothetical protein [Alphaproteobacteria bacterium]